MCVYAYLSIYQSIYLYIYIYAVEASKGDRLSVDMPSIISPLR